MYGFVMLDLHLLKSANVVLVFVLHFTVTVYEKSRTKINLLN